MDDHEILEWLLGVGIEPPEGGLQLGGSGWETVMLALHDRAMTVGGQEVIDRLVSVGVLVYEGNNTYRLVPEMIPGD